MSIYETDKEFMEIFTKFTDDVKSEKGQQLPEETRYLAILAALMGCQGAIEFREVLPEALKAGLSAAAVKEVVYQGVDYLGMGRVRPFLDIVNEVLTELQIPLPAEPRGTTTPENRLEKGAVLQAEIFGEHMHEAWKNGHINRWLAENCFGDFYTRDGLTLAQREMITFCFLMAQGGCEPQLTGSRKGQYEPRQRQGVSCQSRFPVLAVYRLSAQLKRDCVRE